MRDSSAAEPTNGPKIRVCDDVREGRGDATDRS